MLHSSSLKGLPLTLRPALSNWQLLHESYLLILLSSTSFILLAALVSKAFTYFLSPKTNSTATTTKPSHPCVLLQLFSTPLLVSTLSIFLLFIHLLIDTWLCPACLKSSLTSHLALSYLTGCLHLIPKISPYLKLLFCLWDNILVLLELLGSFFSISFMGSLFFEHLLNSRVLPGFILSPLIFITEHSCPRKLTH